MQPLYGIMLMQVCCCREAKCWKSTLSNQMIGQKLSIVTDKPQTTRHRILGICSAPEYQMILYDTRGVIEKKMHKLDSMMMKNIRSATINADCVLVVVDACKPPENIGEVLKEGVGELKDNVPVLLVFNKRDLIKPGEIIYTMDPSESNQLWMNLGRSKSILDSILVVQIQ